MSPDETTSRRAGFWTVNDALFGGKIAGNALLLSSPAGRSSAVPTASTEVVELQIAPVRSVTGPEASLDCRQMVSWSSRRRLSAHIACSTRSKRSSTALLVFTCQVQVVADCTQREQGRCRSQRTFDLRHAAQAFGIRAFLDGDVPVTTSMTDPTQCARVGHVGFEDSDEEVTRREVVADGRRQPRDWSLRHEHRCCQASSCDLTPGGHCRRPSLPTHHLYTEYNGGHGMSQPSAHRHTTASALRHGFRLRTTTLEAAEGTAY